MKRLTLLHLTLTGRNVPPASIDFSRHVTVIHGPSDTGKSFIVDAIDFMLGAKKLREIPEREGYDRVLLGLELPDGECITLARSVEGGPISLYRSDVRFDSSASADELLEPKHNKNRNDNISRFLLNQIGLDDRWVRKSAKNATNMLSFRDLVRLFLVGETEIQAEEAPGLSSNNFNRTKEISVLKLLLSGEDDSLLTEVPSAQEQKRLRGARQEVAEGILKQLELQLQHVADPVQLKVQFSRLNNEIRQHNLEIGGLTQQRGQLVAELSKLQTEGEVRWTEYSDAKVLRQRFALLRKQYESDLERLTMIAESGNLLGYFERGTCVFCGAEPDSQHYNSNCERKSTDFHVAVESEAQKTQDLLDDLLVTIASLEARVEALSKSVEENRRRASILQNNIEEFDSKLNAEKGSLVKLFEKRGETERHLFLYEQVKVLENLIHCIAHETEVKAPAVFFGLSSTVERRLSSRIASRLSRWGFPYSSSTYYDGEKFDIIAGGQMRSAHGKGVRAVLHAAFTLALAEYCFDYKLPHPGFVVLDSPLVTYRPPDQSVEVDDMPPEGFVRAFYRDIQDNFIGQVIVMENTDPVESLESDSCDIHFTKRVGIGRYGFLSTKTFGADILPDS